MNAMIDGQRNINFRGSIMQKFVVIFLFAIFSLPTYASADWLIYHKPAFEGQILDAETKQPIEGAIVVALYNKRTMGLGAGTLSSVINIRETFTNKDGRFSIPSYTTFIQPFSWSVNTTFIIYKPGYVSIDGMNLEDFFAGRKVGRASQELPWFYNKTLVVRLRSPNIVELSAVKTKEERVRTIPARDPELRKMAPDLIRIINDERSSLL